MINYILATIVLSILRMIVYITVDGFYGNINFIRTPKDIGKAVEMNSKILCGIAYLAAWVLTPFVQLAVSVVAVKERISTANGVKETREQK